MVYQAAGSNATAIIGDITNLLEDIKKDLPPGMEIETTLNANDFLFASIHEVIKTLIEAFILVFFVVYVFLQDFRSTLIPAIAIPVSLIGTFFALYLMGFSLNLLTLCALVLAIAIVVDDAIVVVEGVHAKLDQGYKSPRKASDPCHARAFWRYHFDYVGDDVGVYSGKFHAGNFGNILSAVRSHDGICHWFLGDQRIDAESGFVCYFIETSQ